MKKHYLISISLLIIISVLNYLIELNAYTAPTTVGEITVSQTLTTPFKVVDIPISLITKEEHCVTPEGNRVSCHELQDIKDGDILISKSSHTLFIRHGHAGVVVDAKNGLVVEAMGYGAASMLQPLSKWNEFPTVKVLRLKDRDEDMISELVKIAQHDFIDINYDIFATRANNQTTHCSDIVWKIFNQFGYDLDSNGGIFVTPQDISNSDLLYEVEVHGFSSERKW
ncbi:MAG: YiiX/YebB-like N1pC/P60 family cysteine hydrolase [Turicibacter sp.]